MPNPTANVIYELRVTLQGINPPIWRTAQVPSNITLYRLHNILQIVMGWTNSHLHQFEKDGHLFGRPEDFESDEPQPTDDKKARLAAVLLNVGDRIIYKYDFGDCWQHDIILERILPNSQHTELPICLSGERHCPPEDVGGVSGYEDFLEAIFDPTHEDPQPMLEWIGERFQPEEFDSRRINAQLARKSRR